MNENWVITYEYNTGLEHNTFTGNGILDAIQQLAESGIPIGDIVKIELEE